ncbi:molecular chaperone Hsp33 [Enhydrobacter aerosaccus]|uniref:Molecular chaperone Hsp33 n=1 Tax=Enhydrobacter aerosaccus TaxID=225324 RepID=A0A1T4SW61_9HYPH|nr:Hsp33 family molecular chaperone HslO [Enhydrobacter aerosaccus]SKA32433.1 molecular chaperone Hsp33 [Enhydrobacter aerosaccus]
MGTSEGGLWTSDDQALPFQLDALGVRGRLVRLGPTLDAVIERHGYPLAVARPLAEAMVLCAALATSLKYDGIFTLQITGDGPIRLLVTDLTTDGALRGYAQFDSWKLAVALGAGNSEAPDGYVPKLFGSGRLAFTVDQGQYTERYQGVVPLEGPTLADCAHTYFRQSEQLPTGIKIAARRTVTDGTPHWRAAALMVQQMPEFDAGRLDIDAEQREDDWRKAVILMASATEAEMLDPNLPASHLLYRLFHQEQPRVFETRPFIARCRCSRARIDRVLRSIKREELDDMRDATGRVSVKCEFCSTEYAYDDNDLDRIYASAA